MFTPYSAVRPELLREGRGTGLGLSLAKEIVIMHGGRVLRESEQGRGSAFGFCIPFDVASKEEVPHSAVVRAFVGPTSHPSPLTSPPPCGPPYNTLYCPASRWPARGSNWC